MKKSYSKSKKNFLALLLSVLMVTSCATAFASCGDSTATDSSSSSVEEDTSTSVNDTGLIKNANFKTANTNKGLSPIVTTVTGWSRSVNSNAAGNSASGSNAPSGIINTEAEAWEMLTRLEKNVEITEAEAKANWDEFSVSEKLAYYEYWKEQNPNDKNNIKTKLADFYQTFSGITEQSDLPTVNPGTHYAADEKEDGETPDTNVLMINNQGAKNAGTSQKYTSSSTVTVPAGAAVEFSVWVKTADLQSVSTSNGTQEAIGKGAYVRVTHSVGSKSLPAFEIKNINTELSNPDGENNGWVQYSFYLAGSSYTDTTFNIVLGLGQGTSSEREENVNGYAFFDDIECELVKLYDQDEFDGFGADAVVNFVSEKDEKIVDSYENPEASKFILDFHGGLNSSDILSGIQSDSITYTTGTHKDDDTYTSHESNPIPTMKKGLSDKDDVKGVYSMKDLAGMIANNDYLEAVYNNYLVSDNEKGAWLEEDEKMLLIMSAQGIAYTAKDALTFDFLNADTNEYEDYMLISFFVKTSDLNGFTGAGITLDDNGTKTSFSSIDTSKISPVKIGDNEDVYDGWQQVFFFVENGYEEDAAGNKSGSFTLSFNYGLTDVTGATEDSFYAGFAAFTGFETYYMSKDEYTAAAAGTYAKKVIVANEDPTESTGNSGFDSATETPTDALKEGFARPKNYTAVYSSNYYVNQPEGEFDPTVKDPINAADYANAGLLNKDYFIGTEEEEGYFAKNSDLVQKLTQATGETTAEGVWNAFFGSDVSQPLLIWNEDMTDSLGYIGAKKTISANGYATVSVRVKVSNASAYVYLIDMDDTTYSSTLSVDGNLVYWYDEDGNICTGDPTENKTQKAFLLQGNGLYKANSRWSKYNTLTDKDGYYANLEAYDLIGNNLVVAENGAAHDYTEKDANGRVIAFYGDGNGNFYADEAKTVKVNNLFDITKTSEEDDKNPLPYRYLAADDKELVAQVNDTHGEWATVTFYIHAGAYAKNYRLEVWSGSRDGKLVNANDGSYVIFDTNNLGDVSSNFSTLMDEYKELDGVDTFESIFSYYDTDKFLRYNKDLDTNKVGNLYEHSFDPTAQTEGVVYLKYQEKQTQTVLVDYSIVDVEVIPETVEDKTETDDDDHDHDHEDDGMNFALLFSSIAIAVVLLFAIASIIIRKALVKYRKTHGVKVKAPKAKTEKKVKPAKAKKTPETQDEDSTYND